MQTLFKFILYLCFVVIFVGLVQGEVDQAIAQGNTYYISSSTGNDNNSGTSSAQAWQTLNKINAKMSSLQPGEKVLFKRGDTFYGQVNVDDVRGTASNPITFGAYGSGPSPIVSGLTTLNGWVSVGGNKWQANCPNCGATLNNLLLDGKTQRIARWPNWNETDRGYLYYEAFDNSANTLTDNELSGAPNWTGGDLVLRTELWILDRLPIEAHTGQTLKFDDTDLTYDVKPGFGYFIQNHAAALDQDGEWVYDPATKKVTLYLAQNPGNRVQVPTVDTVWKIRQAEHLVIRELVLSGGNELNLDARGGLPPGHNAIINCVSIKLEQVEVLQAGIEGVKFYYCRDIEISNNHIHDVLDRGLWVQTCDDCLIHHNLIENIGLFAGMGQNKNGRYVGASAMGSDVVFEYNRVNKTGYIGVNIHGQTTARYNYVSNFNLEKNDGGGIYHGTNPGGGSKIIGNIVTQGMSHTAGVPKNGTSSNDSHGIYLDGDSEYVEVRDNTVAFVGGSGFNLTGSQYITIANNLVYGAEDAQISFVGVHNGKFHNEEITVVDNTFVTHGDEAKVLGISTKFNEAYFTKLGQLSGNVYCNPFSETLMRRSYPGMKYSLNYWLNLRNWQEAYQHDLNSTACSTLYKTHTVTGQVSENVITNGTFDNDLLKWGGGPSDGLEASLATDKLDGGSLKLTFKKADTTGVYIGQNFGPVVVNKVYRLKFDVIGEEPGGTIWVGLLQQKPGAYHQLAESHAVPVDTQPQSHEIYFTATRSTDSDGIGRLNFNLRQDTPVVWLDNIELQEVEATPVEIDDLVRFEFNASETTKSFNLDGYNYVDPAGKSYKAGQKITLAPYASIILMKQEYVGSIAGSIYLPLVVK